MMSGNDFRMYQGMDFSDFLAHYGVGHEHGGHSGRFQWGSGERPWQRTSRDGQSKFKRPFQDKGGQRYGSSDSASVKAIKSDSIHKSAIAAGFKPLSAPESREEAMKNCNPYRGKFAGKDNCFSCGLSGYLREHGIDSKGVVRFDGGVLADKILDKATANKDKIHISVSFDEGEEARVIYKAIPEVYGNNASGLIGVRWQGGGGHIYNFETKNGKVEFIDYQSGTSGKEVDSYLDHIDMKEPVILYRLDDAELDMSKLKKYVKAS